MRFSAITLAALVPAFVSAETIDVIVGRGEDGQPANVIRPNVINAKVGDLINFQFLGGNHTVTQSSFAAPCTQQFNTVTQQPGIDSGFMPFDAASGQVGQWTINITQVDSPIWLFCNRDPHCKNGMVAAINPPTSGERTFEAFVAKLSTAEHPGPGNFANFTPPAASGSASVSAALPSATGGAATGTGSAGTGTAAVPSASAGGASGSPSASASGTAAPGANGAGMLQSSAALVTFVGLLVSYFL